MASVITHAFSSLILGKALLPKGRPWSFWSLLIIGAILPDVDILTFSLGYSYEHILSHRGFTHSLFFALFLSLIVLGVTNIEAPRLSWEWWRLFLVTFLIFSSHGFLDALTNGGLGVAFFFPLDKSRYFLPWRPLFVSPLGIESFFGPWGREALLSEIKWVWWPLIFLLAIIKAFYGFPRIKLFKLKSC